MTFGAVEGRRGPCLAQRGLRRWLRCGCRQEGRRAEAASLTLRLLQRRCGPIPAERQARIQGLSLPELESLADALLDFNGSEDLERWLNRQAG